MKIEVNETLKRIEKEADETKEKLGYDGRKKCYKDGQKKLKELEKESHKEIIRQVNEEVKKYGFQFENSRCAKIGNIELILAMYYSPERYRKDYDFSIGLGGHNHFQNCVKNDELEKLPEKIKQWQKEETERQNYKIAKNERATAFYQAVKNDITYQNGGAWYGEYKPSDKLSMQFEGDDFNRTEINAEIGEGYEIEVRVVNEFKSLAEAVEFWNKAKEFIQQYKKKKEVIR